MPSSASLRPREHAGTARRRIAVAAGLACQIAASPVLAQDDPQPQALGRIQITAEKRLTTTDTTPAAVTALPGARLAEAGLTDLADIVTLVPNMSFTTGYGASQLFIRGIGNVFFTAGGDPGVALYTDGAYVSDQTSSNASLFDVQRVEVLRGPQGALYGRNATGGAVNLISARPTASFAAQAGALLGQYGRRETEGFVSGPLGDTGTSARLSFQLKQRDGYIANPLAGQTSGPVLPGGATTVGPSRLDDLDGRALRLQTLTDLGTAGTLRLIVGSYRQEDTGPGNALLVDPGMISQLLYGATPSTDPRVVKSQGASNRVDVKTAQVLYERPIGEHTLAVVLSRRHSQADMIWDGDATEALVANTRFLTHSTDTGLDVHLSSPEGRLQWLVGASVVRFDQRQDIQVDTQVPLGFLVPGAPVTVPVPGGVQFLLGGDVRTRSTAVYGDVRYALSRTFAVTAGLRYNRDDKRADEYQTVGAFGIAGTGSPGARWTSTPASLGFEWQLAPTQLLYGKVSRGFKSGAINLGALQGAPVRPETVTAAEVGYKARLAGDRAALSAAAFWSRYRDMQVSQVGTASAILANASSARIDGVEVELLARPVRPLTLSVSAGLMDPRYERFENVDLRNAPTVRQDVSGRQVAQVSRAQASLGAEWTQPLGALQLSLRGDYVWRSRYYFTEFNTPDAEQPAYGLLHLGLTLKPRQGAWTVYGQLLNGTNEAALTSMNIASPVLGGARQVNVTPPRRIAVGGTFRF